MKPTDMACRWQNRKKRPNLSTNNGDMAETAKHPVAGVNEGMHAVVCDIYLIRETELLKIWIFKEKRWASMVIFKNLVMATRSFF